MVTLTFYTDWQQISTTVDADPTQLMVAGAFLALLFALALCALLTRKGWALDLVIALALVDIVGEFYAQGTIAILITFSFIVACILLALIARRQWLAAAGHRMPVA